MTNKCRRLNRYGDIEGIKVLDPDSSSSSSYEKEDKLKYQ